MNKLNKIFKTIFIISFSCTIFAGCTIMQNQVQKYSENKEKCILNPENITEFEYKEKTYTILNETVSNKELGNWVGYIRKLAGIDENGKILYEENIENLTFKTLSKLYNKNLNQKYVIPFLNVYSYPEFSDCLIVDVNGGYHKAILKSKLTDKDTVFSLDDLNISNNHFEINPNNATELIYNNKIYEVSNTALNKNELGKYIDIIAKEVTFDENTKQPIPKEELKKIDWYGRSSEQVRKSLFYIDVYEIIGKDIENSVAVNINNTYYIATAKEN